MDRQAALDLLNDHHEFPGPYEFRVVVYPDKRATVVAAMDAAAGDEAAVEDVRERESRKGTYLALRVRMRLTGADQVLEVYDVLKALDGVLTTM